MIPLEFFIHLKFTMAIFPPTPTVLFLPRPFRKEKPLPLNKKQRIYNEINRGKIAQYTGRNLGPITTKKNVTIVFKRYWTYNCYHSLTKANYIISTTYIENG